MTGSLSKGVFQQSTSNGSDVFFILKHFDASNFVFVSVFTIIEAICPNIWVKPPSKMKKKDHFRLTGVAQKRLYLSSVSSAKSQKFYRRLNGGDELVNQIPPTTTTTTQTSVKFRDFVELLIYLR